MYVYVCVCVCVCVCVFLGVCVYVCVCELLFVCGVTRQSRTTPEGFVKYKHSPRQCQQHTPLLGNAARTFREQEQRCYVTQQGPVFDK